MYAYCYNNPVMYSDPSGCETNGDLNSSEQLAIDVTLFVIGAYVFEIACKSFGVDGIAKLEGVLGEIVDMEFEVYEFEVSDVFEAATDYSTDISVSGAVEILMLKLFSKLKLKSITNMIISTTLSSVAYAILEEIDLKSGNYILIHFSFLELRDAWLISDWFVHDFFFLYFQSNDRDYAGNLLDESFSPYKFWYSFLEM